MAPLDTLRKDDLLDLADEYGVDLDDATNNAERVKRLRDAGVPDDAPDDPGNTLRKNDPDVPERDPFYCPGCGRGYRYPATCIGTPAAPHQPIQTVDSAELDGDPKNHTPAPPSEGL